MSANIERAGGVGMSAVVRSGVIARAPASWRALAERGGATVTQPMPSPTKSKPMSAVRSLPPVIGWVAGTCCPGVSRPLAHCRQHGETLPETFTPAALTRMRASACSGDEVPVSARRMTGCATTTSVARRSRTSTADALAFPSGSPARSRGR